MSIQTWISTYIIFCKLTEEELEPLTPITLTPCPITLKLSGVKFGELLFLMLSHLGIGMD